MSESYNDRAAPDQFSTREQLNKYFRAKWLFILSFIVVMVLCFAYLLLKTPQYGIYASIVIKDEKKGEPSDFPFRDIDVFDDRNTVDNESEIIRSKTIINTVVRNMKLNINYYSREYLLKKTYLNYASPVQILLSKETQELYESPLKIQLIDSTQYLLLNNNKKYFFDEKVSLPQVEFELKRMAMFATYDKKEIEISVISIDEAAQNLKNKVMVEQTSKNASMLTLQLLHPLPAQGMDILNAIIREYNNSNHRYRQLQTEIAVGIIQQRLNLLAGQLDTIENAVQKYKTNMGITNLSSDAIVFLDRAKESDNKISEAEIKMETLRGIEDFARASQHSPLPPTAGLNDAVLLNLLTKINDLLLEKSELINTLGPENAGVKIVNVQIDEIRKSIIDNITIQKLNIQSALNQLNEGKKKIDLELRNVPLNERNLTRIVREKNIHENIYNYLLQKREEANISSASDYSKLRVVDAAYSSIKPVQPDKLITLLTGLLIALTIPVIIVNVRSGMNSKLTEPDVLSTTNVPLVGEISWYKNAHSARFLKNGYSMVSEQFRIMIARLKAEAPDCKTILITSSEPGEGKSYISTHLAEMLAVWGSKVVLIDADLRKGKLSRDLEIDPVTLGLSDYLSNQKLGFSEIIFRFDESKNPVDVITSGTDKHGVFKMHEGERLKQLFQYLQGQYDYVVVNTPPVKLVSDSLLLAKFSDVTLYVVRRNYTRRNHLRFIASLNKRQTLGKMFLVLNGSSDNYLKKSKKYREYFMPSKTV